MRRLVTLVGSFLGLGGITFASVDIVIPAAETRITAPMTLVDGVLQQPVRSELPGSGTAVFTVKIPTDGDYQIFAEVRAPSADANSFFVNVDAPPEDPRMIWDIFLKIDDFVERAVTWRGNGGRDDPEIDPKFFRLTAGEHRIIVAGREPAQLRQLTVRRYIKPEPGTPAAFEAERASIDVRTRHELARLEDTPQGREAADEVFRRADADEEALRQRAIDLAAEKPSAPASTALLSWVLRSGRASYLPSGPRALALLRRHQMRSPEIGPIIAYFAHYLPDPRDAIYDGVQKLFETAIAENPSAIVRGQAALGLANSSMEEFEALEYSGDGQAIEHANRKTIAAMEAVRRDYGDLPYLRDSDVPLTLGEEAARQLVALRTLRVGMPAPEIDDVDLNGARFKLSDYRGRVVLLVFWGTWCGPCMAAIPRERALIEKFQGRPFTIVGVNSDAHRDRALRAVTRERISWRSFWNGADSHISKAWNVKGWPTAYLIDERGIIRQGRFVDDRTIESVVADAERARAPAAPSR